MVQTKSDKFESRGNLDRMYPRKHQRKKKVEFLGEFRKINPPTYDGENDEDEKSWLLNIKKYFQVYE